jgi:hypothetical protein
MYAYGLVNAAILIVGTVVAAIVINRVREWYEARQHGKSQSGRDGRG